jgi:hypothetical protein
MAPMNSSHFSLKPVLCLAALTMAFTSCANMQNRRKATTGDAGNASGAAALADEGNSIQKLAQVESLQAEISPTQPTEANVIINGLLHDGATRVHDVQQQRLADGFVLTVVTTRPRNAMASLALIPFEKRITLNLQGMSKGPCKIVANGVATTIIVP